MRMAHEGLMPSALQRTKPPPRDAGSSVRCPSAHVRAVTFMAHGDTVLTMYDLLGSLSVFGFFTLCC